MNNVPDVGVLYSYGRVYWGNKMEALLFRSAGLSLGNFWRVAIAVAAANIGHEAEQKNNQMIVFNAYQVRKGLG